MGKCISKDHNLHIKEFADSSTYIAVTDDFEYFHHDKKGQSESKKSKKISGPETKGTAMSFGFKKKTHSSNNKKNATANINNNNIFANKDQESDKYDQQTATIITNHGVVKNDNNNLMITGDDNGNTGYESSNDKDTTGRSTPRLQPAKRDQITGVVGRSNRFGFRQNTVRPASVGLTPKINDFDNVNNNNTVTISTDTVDKRRSKSASATSRTNTQIQVNQQPQVRFNPKTTNFTYQQQQQQIQQQQQSRNIPLEMKSRPEQAHEEKYAVVRTDMHTNSIVRPTPVSVSRYTLHTTSLPKPQYPVPVSLTSANISANRMQSTNQRIGNAMDSKGAKHAANLNRKGGLVGRDESYDSGIASHESFSSNEHQQAMDMKRPRSRGRTIEMVMSGRHKFEIRESNAFNEFIDDHIVPLALPKLPSAFNNERQEIVVGGLVRSTNSNFSFDSDNMMATSSDSRNNNYRQDSITSTSEAESCEEEKLTIDNNSSEKSLKGAIIKDFQLNSKSSSPGSSRASWCNAGESLAVKDCSSISLSSSDEERKKLVSSDNQMKMDEEEDLSTVTITADHTSYLNSSPSKSSPQKSGINDAFIRDPKTVTITRKEFLIQMDEFKFAEMAEAIKDSKLLDDETSPTDSLVSSTTDSDDIGLKKKDNDKDVDEISSKQDDIKEKDLEDITPELVDMISPLTPGTPTHASNSFSLSHEGQDFLIDDEIADQPALVFDENTQNNASQSEYMHSNPINANSETTTTPTLKDVSIDSHGSLKSTKKHSLFNQLQHFSPSIKRNKKKSLTRTESLDTLSPCDSIASDDLMADFDLNSSLDSIDRPAGGSFNSFNNSARHSVDELQIISELESKEHDMIRDWNSLLKIRTRQTSSRENITSQLPARATRLLNRRQQNNSNSPLSVNGSESPRSLDSLHSRTTPSSKTSLKDHLKQRQQNNLQNNLLNSSSEDLLVDKSLRNSMLQDVVHFKKQLVHLRRILQEDEENLMRTDTLNPFEANGHIFTNHVNGTAENPESNTQSDKDKKDDENNVTLTNEQLMMLEDQRQELADLRRQVVYLQSQMDDKDRTIKIQQNMLEKLELEKAKILESSKTPAPVPLDYKDVSNAATQTDRLRPASMGPEAITSRNESLNGTTATKNQPNEEIKIKTSKPNDLLNNAKLPSIVLKVNDNGKIPTITIKPSLPKSKTQISSIYTKLSSIKPTTTTITSSTANTETSATSQPLKNVTSTSTANNNKISSIPNFSNKTVKTTQIGNVFPTVKYINGNTKAKKPELSPTKKTSQLVKPQIVLNNPIKNGKSLMKRSESDGNSQSSLSSSNSSLSANQDIIELKNEYNSVKIGGRNGISKC